jgi:hypothetical protein
MSVTLDLYGSEVWIVQLLNERNLNSYYTEKIERMIVNNKLEMMWNQVVVA